MPGLPWQSSKPWASASPTAAPEPSAASEPVAASSAISDEAPTVEHWEAVAQRTRSVAENWRSLHASEEERADAAVAQMQQAQAAMRRLEQDRDAAMQHAASAAQQLAVVKQERARWRARSDAQTGSKTFLELEASRERLATRDEELTTMMRAFDQLQHEFDAYKAQRKRDDAEREAAARERLEGLIREREENYVAAKASQKQADELQVALSDQLAESPPGALLAMRHQCSRHEETIRELERKNLLMRSETNRWRERARGAMASERLTMLQSGPVSLLSPRSAALSPRSAALAPGGAADATMLFQSKGGWQSSGQYPASSGFPGGGAPTADDIARLRAELSYHRSEAEHEKARQRTFLANVLASSSFSQAQKQKLAEMLRDKVELDEQEAAIADISSPRQPEGAPMVGSLALARPRRA